MKIKNIKYIGILLAGMLCTKAIAQQDPTFTMYQFNKNVLNPAYAGSNETSELTVMTRIQWVGLKNAPLTQTLSFSSPTILGKNMGLGFSIVNDKFNVASETDAYIDFSYKLHLSENLNLFLGLKGGYTFLSLDLASLGVTNDALLSENTSLNNPNFGTGVYLKGANYYVSLSVPALLENKRYEKEGDITVKASDKPNIYISGGYTFDLAGPYKTKLTPSFMIRQVSGAPVSYDFTAIVNMLDNYELGLSHRLKESFGIFGLFKFLEHYKVGYAYEHSISDISILRNNSSHEFVLKYNF